MTAAPAIATPIYASKPCNQVLKETGQPRSSLCGRCGPGKCDRGMPAPAAPAAQQQPEQQGA